MKILILAYASEPGTGSEYGVGWTVPTIMAKRHPEHEIYVLTRSRCREKIETSLNPSKEGLPYQICISCSMIFLRGCFICGACSTVTKEVPPYALVVGSPAKIVGVKFSIDQIIEHEKVLYPEEERFSRQYLEELFAKYYEGKKVFGLSTEFTEANIQRLKQCAKSRKLRNQEEYFEKLKPLCKKL